MQLKKIKVWHIMLLCYARIWQNTSLIIIITYLSK